MYNLFQNRFLHLVKAAGKFLSSPHMAIVFRQRQGRPLREVLKPEPAILGSGDLPSCSGMPWLFSFQEYIFSF
jgi:hypothetical protein